MIDIEIDYKKIKYKPIDKHRIVLCTDRLTRFKETEEKYLRVFKDILINNLIQPKFKKTELDNLEYFKLAKIASYIINESLKLLFCNNTGNNNINIHIKNYEMGVFKINKETETLLDNNINYEGIIPLIPEDCPLNLKWLKEIAEKNNGDETSHSKGYRFPIKKILICEGITEEILLPVFAKLLNYDFDKNGIQIISADGKNQVVKMYYELADKLKIPVFVLLDSDARTNYDEILPKLKKSDKIYIIKHGEFEDILPEK